MPRAACAISGIVRGAHRCGTNFDEEGWHPSKRVAGLAVNVPPIRAIQIPVAEVMKEG
jgi:hypothetical protein